MSTPPRLYSTWGGSLGFMQARQAHYPLSYPHTHTSQSVNSSCVLLGSSLAEAELRFTCLPLFLKIRTLKWEPFHKTPQSAHHLALRTSDSAHHQQLNCCLPGEERRYPNRPSRSLLKNNTRASERAWWVSGACCQAWRSESNPQDPHGRREPTPAHVCKDIHALTHTNQF